jgi:hypothetical protein
VYGACCSAQTANKPVKPVQRSRQQALRAYCSNKYIVITTVKTTFAVVFSLFAALVVSHGKGDLISKGNDYDHIFK